MEIEIVKDGTRINGVNKRPGEVVEVDDILGGRLLEYGHGRMPAGPEKSEGGKKRGRRARNEATRTADQSPEQTADHPAEQTADQSPEQTAGQEPGEAEEE